MQTSYQVGVMGQPNGRDVVLAGTLRTRLTELGIDPSTLSFIPENELGRRNRKLPFVGVFFGYTGAETAKHPILSHLIEDSSVIVPIFDAEAGFSVQIPNALAHINGLQLAGADPSLAKLASLLLENFRLLRSDRRLFISYRRVESQGIAIQLYENLDALGFDVFLDTRGVPPATDFQGVLWHRLADSDIVVLLDTPGFRASRWTREELARANATSIQILHLLWPKSQPDGTSAFSEFYQVLGDHFVSADQLGPSAKFTQYTLN
jgi:hypothetical protein